MQTVASRSSGKHCSVSEGDRKNKHEYMYKRHKRYFYLNFEGFKNIVHYIIIVPSDVAQDGAQEPISDKAEQVHLGGLFKANWAKKESLEANRLCRGLPRDTNIYDNFCMSWDLQISIY